MDNIGITLEAVLAKKTDLTMCISRPDNFDINANDSV